METKILVGYATVHGATREIAEAIAKTLTEQGNAVDVVAMRDVGSLQSYDAVVLGAPQYMFRMHRDLSRFLTKHRQALQAGLPVAIFSGGPFGESDASAWQGVRTVLDKELAKFAWLKPAAVTIVGGRFDPAHLRFPYNLIPAMKQIPPSDLRNWDEINTWAAGLPAFFG